MNLNFLGGTSAAASEFAVDVHEVGEIFGFLIFWRIGSLLGRV